MKRTRFEIRRPDYYTIDVALLIALVVLIIGIIVALTGVAASWVDRWRP